MNSPAENPASGAPLPEPTKPSGEVKGGNIIPVDFGAERSNVAKKMTSREREFLPAALQLIETPVSPTKRLTALVLCSLIGIAVAWSYLARVDMVAVAQGEVAPVGQIKVVQALDTAAIRAIYVDDGDRVKAGQPLVDLDATDIQTDLDASLYSRGQAQLDADVARMLLTRDPHASFNAPAGVDPSLAETNHAEAVNEIEKHLAQISGIEAELAKQEAIVQATNVEIDRAQSTLPLLSDKYKALLDLYQKREGPRPPVLDADQALIEKQAELKTAQATVLQTQAEIQSLQSSREETIAAYLVDAANQRTTALQKIATLDQQIAKDRQRISYRRLIAAVSGAVQSVKIHTPGAVVAAGDTLMTIVPDDAGIEIDAQVDNSDIGFVHEGQPVQVKLDAFPFTRYGLITGKVMTLGRDSVENNPSQRAALPNPSETEAPPQSSLTYPAKISLDRTWLMVDGVKKALKPGMHVAAEIKTGDRRVLEYLLSPIMQATKEAGRER